LKDCAIRDEDGEIATEDNTDEENCPGRNIASSESESSEEESVPVTDVPILLADVAPPADQ